MATKSLMEQAQDLTAQNQVTPTTQDFDESKGVAGRVSTLTSQDSPLMQQARTRGLQSAASRGLTNSSLSAQAAEQAVIGAATPIASADAGLYQQQSLTNQAAKNTASATNAQIGATLGGSALSLENSNEQQGKSLAESARQFDTGTSQQQKQFEASQAQQQGQFDVNQGNAAAQLAQQQQQINAQIDQFAQSLGMTAQDLSLKRDQLSQQDRQFLDGLTLQRDQLAQQQGQFGLSLAEQQAQRTQQQTQFDTNAQQNQQQITNQAGQFGQSLLEQQAQLAQQQKQFEADKQFQTMQSALDRDNKLKIADIQAGNQEAINSNGNISSAWQQMSVNIANVQNNPNLDAATKNTLIRNQMDSFAGFANFWKKAGGATIDVSDLLNFNVTPISAPAPPPSSAPALTGTSGTDNGDQGWG